MVCVHGVTPLGVQRVREREGERNLREKEAAEGTVGERGRARGGDNDLE